MKKIYGATERQDGLYKIGRNKWELIYGFGKDSDDAESGFNYRERFDHKPTNDEIKAVIISQINEQTDANILSGFKWKGNLVWLSEANQLNYSRDFAVAYYCERKGEDYALPTYKFGTDDKPVYYLFETFEEFMQFSKSWSQHIADAVSEGWNEKNNINWSCYDV